MPLPDERYTELSYQTDAPFSSDETYSRMPRVVDDYYVLDIPSYPESIKIHDIHKCAIQIYIVMNMTHINNTCWLICPTPTRGTSELSEAGDGVTPPTFPPKTNKTAST